MAKTYDIPDCPVALTLDLIGERWTILLLRDLLLEGPRRFQDFQASLPGVAPNTCRRGSRRWKTAASIGRQLYSERPPRVEYLLTDKGQEPGAGRESDARLGEQTPRLNLSPGATDSPHSV